MRDMAFSSRFRYRSVPDDNGEPRIATPNQAGLIRLQIKRERKERKRKERERRKKLKEERDRIREEQRRLRRGGLDSHL